MAAVLKFERRDALPAVAVDPFQLLPTCSQAEAHRRLEHIREALERVRAGVAPAAAAKWLAATRVAAESEGTYRRWLGRYLKHGLIGLASGNLGRQRKDYGWESKALELYQRPTRPAYATVALWLREHHGYTTATEHLVRRFLKAAPSNAAETSPKRLGAHYYRQNVRPHVIRDATVLPVGYMYEADGHTCDVYVAAPATGNAYRPELTVWIDVRSHFVVGWYLSDSESANTTMFSLSHAMIRHDHVPAGVHADVGSGYVAKTVASETSGFLARFAIKPMFALPGNAKGKGLIEGFWRWFEERCGKLFETYCGHDRTDNFLRHLSSKVDRGLIRLPTLQQFADACRDYFDFYNRNAQKALGCAPRDLWAMLVRVPLETPAAAVIRPREERTVRRWGIALHNRIYRGAQLAAYEGRKVLVQYDLHNDMSVDVLDLKGRWLCEAQLVEKHPWMPDSRIEEQQQVRLAGQQQRLQNKADEAAARARMVLEQPAFMHQLNDDNPVHVFTPCEPPPTVLMGYGAETPRPRALPSPKPSRPVDEAEVARIADYIADSATVQREEQPEERFLRALDIQQLLEAGTALCAEDARWFATYSQSAECQGLADLYQAFGDLPGQQHSPTHNGSTAP